MSFEETIAAIVRQVVREELDARLPRAPPPPAAELLTVAEVARRCGGVTPATVRGWIAGGQLVAKKAGHRHLVAPAQLERFLEEQRRPTLAPVGARVSEVDDQAGRLLSMLNRPKVAR